MLAGCGGLLAGKRMWLVLSGRARGLWEGGGRSQSILSGRMRHAGSPSPETTRLGLGAASPAVPVPAVLSQPCSSALSCGTHPKLGPASQGLSLLSPWSPGLVGSLSLQLVVGQIKSLLLGC